MKLFTIMLISLAGVWTWASMGFMEAFWLVLACGIILAIVFTVADLVMKLEDYFWRKRHMQITVVHEQQEIVDAEIVEEKDGKWWRV